MAGDGLAVRGGSGGTTAWLDDLDRLAAVLQAAAGRLDEVALGVAGVARDAALPGLGSGPLAAARAEWALAGVLLGPHGVAVCALRLAALSASVEAAVAAYRGAEAGVALLFQQVDLAAGRLLGGCLLAAAPQLGVLAVGVVAGSRIPLLHNGSAAGGERLLEFLSRHPVLSEHLMAAAPGLVDDVAAAAPGAWVLGLDDGFLPRDPRQAAALVGALGTVSPMLREPAAVRTTSTPLGPGRPPTGVGDLLGRVSRMSPGEPGPGGAPVPPGTVRVERVTGADGRRAWIVEIPGTHVWNPDAGPDPFDLTSCVHAMAGQSNAVGATVVAALHQAGARPDEPVLLAGHSLGGIAAAQLAADPAVRRSLRITHVVTAGSPVALSGVPADVHVLSIEHTDDLVPRLDGAQNPDRPGWLTVSAPATEPPPPGAGDAHPRLAVTHDAGGYARTAAAVDSSADPSLVAYRAELAPFLDRPGATVLSWDVTGQRLVPSAGGVR